MPNSELGDVTTAGDELTPMRIIVGFSPLSYTAEIFAAESSDDRTGPSRALDIASIRMQVAVVVAGYEAT